MDDERTEPSCGGLHCGGKLESAGEEDIPEENAGNACVPEAADAREVGDPAGDQDLDVEVAHESIDEPGGERDATV